MHIPIMLEIGATMPSKAHSFDAGFDLYSRVTQVVSAHDSAVFDTGVHMCIPSNYCGLLVSKSGLNTHSSITSTGLVDAGYIGSIKVKLYNHGYDDYTVHEGDKISQIVLLPYLSDALSFHLVNEESDLPHSERGSNGFGSSGK